jgi:hypothetical protein
MSLSSPTNPYESPREAGPNAGSFTDRDSELADLRRRVAELERQVGRSWVVHRNIFLRIFAVWGYLLLGYAMLAAVVWGIMGLIWLVRGGGAL